MSFWRRLKNLWRLSGMDFGKVEEKYLPTFSNSQKAEVVEMTDILDKIEL